MATVGIPEYIAEKSAESATLGTTIRVLSKDIAEIEQETKAAKAAYKAARTAGDEAAATAAWAQITTLNDEYNRNIAQLLKAKGEKTYIDGNIARLQQREKELADEEKAPIPITAESNPSGIPTGPTSTITEGNRNAPLPVAATSDPAVPAAPGAYIPINSQKPGEDQPSITAANTPVQPQKVVDEFDGIDAQVAANAAADESAAEQNRLKNTNSALGAALADAQTQATRQDKANFNAKKDWRVRLSLAGGADYLYKAEDPGILGPLVQTNGVIFPYTPAISVAYAAQYDPTTLTHTNYKFYSYNSSSVDQITLSCDFTAQDVFEANYLLAVIHFFRSVTKMFYGQDNNPKNGTPPPLCYLYGLGAFQFDSHPLAVTNFTYSLPTDVDYIRAGEVSAPKNPPATYSKGQVSKTRLQGLQPGAGVAPPQFSGAYRVLEPTYVPTKIQISITAVPIMTRNMVSNDFSLKQYATGQLIRGTQAGSNGGFW